MSSDIPTLHHQPTDASQELISTGSYVDWSAILAGGIFALAFSFLLFQFGATLGLSLTSPYLGEGVSASWLAIAAGIWFAWVIVSGFGAGGYLSGRMRRRADDAASPEVEMRDGAHGLMVWATGVLVGTVLAAIGVSGLLTAGAATVGPVSEAAAEAFPSDYLANVMLRSDLDEPEINSADTAAPREDGSAAAVAGSGRAGDRQGVGTEAVDPAIQQQIASVIARSVFSGEMADRDRRYLVQLVAANTALEPAAVRTRVDEVIAEIDEARVQAREAVEKARVAGVVYGFIVAATLLVGAVAAFFAATLGGRHRDEGLGFEALIARR